MEYLSRQISRRRFIGDLAKLAFAGAVALPIDHQEESPQKWHERYKGYSVIRSHDNNLYTPGINARYLQDADPETQRVILGQMRELGVKVIRILIPDIEPNLGQLNLNYLDKIVSFGEMVKSEIPGGAIELPIFDFYPMVDRDSVDGGARANSAYQVNSGKGRHEIELGLKHFYENERIKDSFKCRCKTIMQHLLRHNTPIAAWEIANEPQPHAYDTGYEQFNLWMGEMQSVIRNLDANHFVLPGVAKPWFLHDEHGFSANTAHIYPDTLNLGRYIRFFRETKKPISVEEIGVFSRFFGRRINLDNYYFEFNKYIFEASSEIDHFNKTIRPGFTTMLPWQISHQEDWVTIYPGEMPRAMETIRVMNEILSRAT